MAPPKLIAITRGVGALSEKSPEELIIYAARVSNPGNQPDPDNNYDRLLRYCFNHGHFSIFETVSMTVEITTSRAISSQIIRHRSFTFQEFSQRYAAVAGVEPVEFRRQHPTNRQMAVDDFSENDKLNFKNMVNEVTSHADMIYNSLLHCGVAKECARFVLPMSARTTFYMTGNVRSWIFYLRERCGEATQKEHRDIAIAIRDTIFKEAFPIIFGLL